MATTKIQPIHDRILVQREAVEERTAGGLIIPGVAQDKPQYGRVVAAGTGIFVNGLHVQMIVKEGDRILFGKYSGHEVNVQGKELLIMREEDVLGVVTECE